MTYGGWLPYARACVRTRLNARVRTRGCARAYLPLGKEQTYLTQVRRHTCVYVLGFLGLSSSDGSSQSETFELCTDKAGRSVDVVLVLDLSTKLLRRMRGVQRREGRVELRGLATD